jgi:Domain of unknown function (DUF4468) with TBP-like fold
MKQLKFALLATLVLVASCATQPYVPIETTEVVNLPGQKQRDIYNKTRQWFSQYFVSGKSVVDYENAEAGTIIGNGVANIGRDPLGLIAYDIHYNVRIDMKDEKLRAVTRIIKHTNTDHKSTYDVSYSSEERDAKAKAHISMIVADIKKYVSDRKDDTKW